MNPLGQIPFLVHGDFKVGESNAIMVYLCELFDSIPSHYYGSTA
jgi:glutathione S-transferase